MRYYRHLIYIVDSASHILLIGTLLLVITTKSLASEQLSISPEFINNSDTSNSGSNGSIVVTLKPLYSLVSHLTDGINTPSLLIKQIPSSHHYSMRPSERQSLADARLIIWFGPQIEPYLSKTVQQLENSTSGKTLVISAMRSAHLKLLNKRTRNSQVNHIKIASDNVATASDPNRQSIDPHIWLSTHNATAISKHITEALISIDAKNAAAYKKNLQQLLGKIEQTEAFIKTTLNNNASSEQQPFIVYHDAFQYFENENQLNFIDSISYDEEAGPSLKHIRQIRAQIDEKNIRCLIYQAPRPAVINSLTAQTAIRATALDPLGMKVSNDKDAWFELMRQLATGFEHCLNQ